MLTSLRTLRLIPASLVLALATLAGTAHAETTGETDGEEVLSSIVIVEPLAEAELPESEPFNVRIESSAGSSGDLYSVTLRVNDELAAMSCDMPGVCNIEVPGLAAGSYTLVASLEGGFSSRDSEPVAITVKSGAEPESSTAGETAGETVGETAGESATETAGDSATETAGDPPTTGAEPPTGDTEATGAEPDSDGSDGDKGCGCVSGGSADPLALGVLLLGGVWIRRRRA